MTKYCFLLIVFILSGKFSSAQIEKGRLFATGQFNFSETGGKIKLTEGDETRTEKTDKSMSGGIGLGAGYFITNHIAIGLGISFQVIKTIPTADINPVKTYRALGGNLFGRYYISMGEKFYFFGQLGYLYADGINKCRLNGTSTISNRISTHSIYVAPGFSFFPTQRIGLEVLWGSLNWQSTSIRFGNGRDLKMQSSNFSAAFDLTEIKFGINYFFK